MHNIFAFIFNVSYAIYSYFVMLRVCVTERIWRSSNILFYRNRIASHHIICASIACDCRNAKKKKSFLLVALATLLNCRRNARVALNLILMWINFRMQISSLSWIWATRTRFTFWQRFLYLLISMQRKSQSKRCKWKRRAREIQLSIIIWKIWICEVRTIGWQ